MTNINSFAENVKNLTESADKVLSVAEAMNESISGNVPEVYLSDDVKLPSRVHHHARVHVAIQIDITVGIQETRTAHLAGDGIGLKHHAIDVVVALLHIGHQGLQIIETVVQYLVFQLHVFQLTGLHLFFRRLEEGEQQHSQQESQAQNRKENQHIAHHRLGFGGFKHLKILGQLVEYVTLLFCDLSD